jgi:hypothetical protein
MNDNNSSIQTEKMSSKEKGTASSNNISSKSRGSGSTIVKGEFCDLFFGQTSQKKMELNNVCLPQQSITTLNQDQFLTERFVVVCCCL